MGVVLLQLMAIGVELEEIAEKYLEGFRPSLKNWGKTVSFGRRKCGWPEHIHLSDSLEVGKLASAGVHRARSAARRSSHQLPKSRSSAAQRGRTSW